MKTPIIFLNQFDAFKDYSNPIEDAMLKFFEKTKEITDEKLREYINKNFCWHVLYHLSPQRRALLDWFDFNRNDTLLEIGAGCGALTGLFCEKLKKVTALELLEIRGKIIYARHKKFDNLEIAIGNLDNFIPENTYDYVTSIGVLEYAGRYIEGDKNSTLNEPYKNFLKKTRSFLKQKGHLLLAIENKLGLKYWSGCKEDHDGIGYSSIEDYPDYEGIKTFGLKELKNIIINAGFKINKIYFPFPDYKLPYQIFSDQFLPGEKISLSSLYPTPDPSQEREFFFSETMSAYSLNENGLCDNFANSFLIIAEKI